MSVDVESALKNKPFAESFAKNRGYFKEAKGEKEQFVGVWALEYMKLTEAYLKERGSNAKIILGGWGGGNQLPSLLKGLNRALPKEVIFSCLNPDLGKTAQPQSLAEIAQDRPVWAVPWLEGDRPWWHFQPRVAMRRVLVSGACTQ